MVHGHGRGGKFQGDGEHKGGERDGGANASGKRAAGASARQDKRPSTATGACADVRGGKMFPGACGRSTLYAAILNTEKNKVVSSFAPSILLFDCYVADILPVAALFFYLIVSCSYLSKLLSGSAVGEN